MAKLTLAHIEHLSQQLSDRYKSLNDLMSHAWLEHEFARKAHDQWLHEENLDTWEDK